MDRNISYAGQVPRALDFLRTGEFAMVGLAKIAEAMLGTSAVVSQGGFAVTPGSGLNIAVAPGQIYQLQSIEPTSLSALNVDGHQVLKQGVALDGQTLTLAPPATIGYAQNVLVQAAYADVQDGSIVLSYQNPTPVLDPNTGALKYVTYPGPGGNGAAQYTILRGAVSLNAKPGVAAPAGQQTTPAPDVGYVGLYVVTLAYGATSISSGSIAPYVNAPFIPITLPQVPAAIQAQAGNGAPDTGTANAMVLALPAYTPGALPDYTPIRFKKGPSPNTGPTTVAINGTSYAVQTFAGAALTGGELPGNCSGAGIILGGALRLSGGIGSGSGSGTGVIVVPSQTLYVRTDGSDANDGSSNDAGHAFATLAAAIAASFRYVTTGNPVVIRLGLAGTYAAPGRINLSGRSIQILGDTANQSAFVISGPGGSDGTALVQPTNGFLTLSGVTLQNTGNPSTSAIAGLHGALLASYVTFQTMVSNPHFHLGTDGGSLLVGPGCIFASSMGGWLECRGGYAQIDATGTLTFQGTPAWSVAGIVAADAGVISFNRTYAPAISGSATGVRFISTNNGVLQTWGSGVNLFPGNSAGITSNGGQYV